MLQTPEQILGEWTATWMALQEVIGTGVGTRDDLPCLMVLAAAPHARHAEIPAAAGGYPVRVEIVGAVVAL